MIFKNKTTKFLPLIVIVLTVVVLISVIEVPKLFSKTKSKDNLLDSILINKIVSIPEKSLKDNHSSDQDNYLVDQNSTIQSSAGEQDEQPDPVKDPANSDPDQLQESSSNSDSDNSKDQKDLSEMVVEVENIDLDEIETMIKMYDYDRASELLEKYPDQSDKRISELTLEIKNGKNNVVLKNPLENMHVFFHSLIYDTSKAFDNDYKADGYNQFFTTCLEFDRMLEQLYERDYVLVAMHDLAKLETDENGNQVMVPGEIYLPENKKLLVLSVDDVNYYEYMEDDGFANRLVLDQNGKVTCSMLNDQGMTVLGDYDVVPILDKFVESHPDFSYRGAKGILALTGYEGALGYRTDERYKDTNPNFDADIAEAQKVAQALRDTGWEFASHSWGHIDLNVVSFESFQQDADLWDKNIEPIIGETDIMIYPFGSPFSWSIDDYNYDNQCFAYLKQKGFDYFCTVDGSKQYTTSIRDDFLLQGRRNLDGYRMFYNPELIDDLIDADYVFDETRPLPVPPL
ncbi:MAG TPA: polysaccharide deacetylase [Clostridiaceae bacterium]|nr:polysaccharide deacetylase [Clostridiaceae bacterium]